MEKQPQVSVGRPRKRSPVVQKIAEALSLTLTPDILSIEDMKGFPELAKESERNQLIMAGTALGLSQPFIAKALKVSQPTINEIINRIDPDKMFRVSAKAKKAFQTQLYESRCSEALISITPEKLEESSASDLARIAKTMSDAAQSLNTTKHKDLGGNKMDLLLDQMAKEAEDADYTMEEG